MTKRKQNRVPRSSFESRNRRALPNQQEVVKRILQQFTNTLQKANYTPNIKLRILYVLLRENVTIQELKTSGLVKLIRQMMREKGKYLSMARRLRRKWASLVAKRCTTTLKPYRAGFNCIAFPGRTTDIDREDKEHADTLLQITKVGQKILVKKAKAKEKKKLGESSSSKPVVKKSIEQGNSSQTKTKAKKMKKKAKMSLQKLPSIEVKDGVTNIRIGDRALVGTIKKLVWKAFDIPRTFLRIMDGATEVDDQKTVRAFICPQRPCLKSVPRRVTLEELLKWGEDNCRPAGQKFCIERND